MTVPLILLALCLISLGIMLPSLGFYWDDWAKILVSRLYGLSGYWAYYAADRPSSAWTHIVLTPLLGNAPLAWQIFDFLMRWLSGVAIWWTLKELWPTARRIAVASAALFIVYPVFTLQPIAVTFHQQWLQYALFLFSLGAMVQAVRQPQRKWLWTGAALLANVVQLTVTEYFIGVELVRPVLVWILASQMTTGFRKRLVFFLRAYWPYAIILVGYVAWRLFFIKLPGADPYQASTLFNLIHDPRATIGALSRSVILDTREILIGSWKSIIVFKLPDSITRFQILAVGAGMLSAVGLIIYFIRGDGGKDGDEAGSQNWVPEALIVGLVATLAGVIPAWATGRDVLDGFHANRYAMPAMFGASLLWATLIAWFSPRRAQQAVLFGLLIGGAVSFQLFNNNDFRWVWQSQTQFYWQMSWRAPSLTPGTALFFEDEPFPNQALFSTSSAINLLYPQPQGWNRLAYWVYTLKGQFSGSTPVKLSKAHLQTTFRTLHFEGTGSNGVLYDAAPVGGNCAWVLTSADVNEPYLSEQVKSMLPAFDDDAISATANAGYPPTVLIGKEPAHGWCYFFEKADLAKQTSDWTTAANLGDQAQRAGYSLTKPSSNSPHEWMPFIEAYAHVGRWTDATDLTSAAFARDPKYKEALCSLWNRIGKLDGGSAPGAQMQTQLGCSGS